MPVVFTFPETIVTANIYCAAGATKWGPYDIASADGTTVSINLPDSSYDYIVKANNKEWRGTLNVVGGNAYVTLPVIIPTPFPMWILVPIVAGFLGVGIYIFGHRKRRR